MLIVFICSSLSFSVTAPADLQFPAYVFVTVHALRKRVFLQSAQQVRRPAEQFSFFYIVTMTLIKSAGFSFIKYNASSILSSPVR